ncbi:hypothetical protein [Streptomyces sp. WAC06128]|uniref:hypothetical protein n=1 Tax=Streptomyces sp. WAC06128 TaxID=2487426 RepID=UPI000F9996E5|nr:hypothetical protein [Streptomyces sp. WAC06128]RSS67691.1 hypothetical protein EF911_34770 [Streptomyces sp. WAC06128]
MAAQRLHPCADLLGDGLRQRGQHPLDPGQITVLVQSGIVNVQATSAQELADGLGSKMAVEAGQVVDVALDGLEAVLEPVAGGVVAVPGPPSTASRRLSPTKQQVSTHTAGPLRPYAGGDVHVYADNTNRQASQDSP